MFLFATVEDATVGHGEVERGFAGASFPTEMTLEGDFVIVEQVVKPCESQTNRC